ncbi:MAG: efflux RND transporter periplasmic adaptor subunit [Aureliella sp.]
MVTASTKQPATVVAFHEAQVFANLSGYVAEVQADIGQVVAKGDVLATLHVPELDARSRIQEARYQKARADMRRSKARVSLAEAQLSSARSLLEQSKAEVSQVDALLAAAEAEFSRTSDLVQRQSLQARMLDEARQRRDSQTAALIAKQASVASATSMVAVAEAQLDASQSDLEAAQVDVQIAEAELEEVKAIVSYTELVAPFDGIVTTRDIDPGDLLKQRSASEEGGNGQRALFTVSQVSKVRVRIPVPEKYASHVNVGDSATLSFPSYANEPAMEVAVSRIAGSLDASTRTMLVECDVENSDGKLLPGMFGQAELKHQGSVAINLLPTRAVRFDAEGRAQVYVLRDDTVEVVSVETGRDDGSMIEIRSGVSENQVVVDTHLRRFLGGEKVSVLQN